MNLDTYTPQQVILHWISAVIIVYALVSGFYVAYADVSEDVSARIGWINVSLTTLYIPIFLVRCLVRLTSPTPAAVHGNGLGHRVARLMHDTLYVLTALVLLSGVLMMSRSLNVFDWFELPAPLSDAVWQDRWFTVHVASCVLLALAVSLHVAAVCLHHLQGRPILRRMSL